jgi:hypothetical protein
MILGRKRRWDKAVNKGGCGEDPLIARNHVALNWLAWLRMAISGGGGRKMQRGVSQAAMFNDT